MSNRWGKNTEHKSGTKTTGQNHINININFNAVKQKTNAFTGKKIDNCIEINHSPKNNASRPNVSMQTLKQKKKKQIQNNDVNKNQSKIQRKKSKSKLLGSLQTPEKYRQQHYGDEKSTNKKSTQKRKSKSHQKYRYMGIKKSADSKQHSNLNSRSNSKTNSKSKSRSHSQSAKKYLKVSQNNTKSTTRISSKNISRPHTADIHHKNIKKQHKQFKNQKPKKSIKKQQTAPTMSMRRKKSEDHFARKKMSIQDHRKVNNQNKNKSRKISQSTRNLRPLPLVHGDEDQSFDEQQSYSKIQKQAKKLLFNQQNKTITKQKHKIQEKVPKKPKKQQTIIDRYMAQAHTYQDVKKLTQVAKTIQRYWRGYKCRIKFVNDLNLMHHKIQISRKKIAQLDPKFWDGASDSILHAEDPQSIAQSQDLNNHSQIDRPQIQLQTSSVGQQLQQNRVVDSNISEELLERMNRLENDLRIQRQKARKLQEQNTNLKNNLQKASALHSVNPSYQSSLKQSMGDSWQQIKILSSKKYQQKNQQKYQQEQESSEFQLRLPKRVNEKHQNNTQNVQKQKIVQQKEQQAKTSITTLNQYKHKMQAFQCSSPKNVTFTIDNSLMQLFQKKQIQVKQNYEKKSAIYERMYADKLFSPRTFSFKKNQLEQTMKKQTENIRNRLEQAQRVASFVKQISSQDKQLKHRNSKKIQTSQQESPQIRKEQQLKIQQLSEIKPNSESSHQKQIRKQINHVVQNYQNIDLHSHRIKQSSDQQSMANNNNEIIIQNHKEVSQHEKIVNQIQSQNQNAIRIFQRVSEELSAEENQNKQSSHDEQQSQQPNQSGVLEPDEGIQQKPKGMQTTLLFIKQYCVSFIEFIRVSEHKDTFIEGLSTPLQYDQIQLLKSYRNTTTNDYDNTYNSHEKQYIYPYFKMLFPRSQVITRQAFNDFNQIYEKLQVQCGFLVQRDYFLISLLDAFNQSLDYQRPASIYGKPPTWISQYRVLKNNKLWAQNQRDKQEIFSSSKFDQACGLAIARVIQWATCLCGFIPESPDMGDVQIGEQQINQIHESRMALMLQKDLLENQQHILDSYVEQTQVRLYLAQQIYNQLLKEFIEQNDFFK